MIYAIVRVPRGTHSTLSADLQSFQVQISEVKESFADQQHLDDSISVVTTLVPCVIGVCEVPFLYLAWKMSRDFGWDIFKNLGADRRIKRMFFKYQSTLEYLHSVRST